MKYILILLACFFIPHKEIYADNSECSDVLEEGVFSEYVYGESDTYKHFTQTILYKTLIDKSERFRSLGLTVPYAEAIVDLNASEDLRKDISSNISSNNITYTVKDRHLNLLLSYADPNILEAWSKCMMDRKSLMMRFSEPGNHKVKVKLKWPGGFGINEIAISDYFMTKGVTVLSGKNILNGKQVLNSNNDYEILLSIPEAKLAVDLAIEYRQANVGDNGSIILGKSMGNKSIFLEPRLRFVKEERRYVWDNKAGCLHRGSLAPIQLVKGEKHKHTKKGDNIYCSHKGWLFDYNTTPTVSYTPTGPSEKTNMTVNVHIIDNTKFQFYVICENDSDDTYTCMGKVNRASLWEWRPRYIPADERLVSEEVLTPTVKIE